MRATQISPPAIIRPADPFEVLRCPCPQCLWLDRRYYGEGGFQLALFPYRRAERPRR